MKNHDGFSDPPWPHNNHRPIDRAIPDELDQGLEIQSQFKFRIMFVDSKTVHPPRVVEFESAKDVPVRKREH